MTCACSIIPQSVLRRFAEDQELSTELRQQFYNSIEIDNHIRALRQETALLTTLMARQNSLAGLVPAVLAPAALKAVYDSKSTTALPGHSSQIRDHQATRLPSVRLTKQLPWPSLTRTFSVGTQPTTPV